MSDDKERYFNFPIQLLKGFLVDDSKCLANILHYAIYAHSLKLELGTEKARIVSSMDFLCVSGGEEFVLKNGKKQYEENLQSSPMVGINSSIFWDFKQNHKTEFEKVCLLAFLALKSIIQSKAYAKIDNKFLLSRMDGKACSCEIDELSDELFKYSSRRLLEKVKMELQFNWYLIYYSRYTRGFYISFKLSLEDLIFEAEKRRASTKEKEKKKLLDVALKNALRRLEAKPP